MHHLPVLIQGNLISIYICCCKIINRLSQLVVGISTSWWR